MKNTKIDLQTNPTLQRQSVACNIPVAQLVGEVYEGASPPVQNQMLAQLVGQVYETAAPAERARLLEQLLHPLGVFALLAVANGIFARIRFRAGWQAMQIRMEDAVEVREDVRCARTIGQGGNRISPDLVESAVANPYLGKV